MRIETLKKMFDACYQAKRTREMLPTLPEGVMPSYIHYLDVIETLEKQDVQVKISDISDALNLPRPGVTRTVKEMEIKGYLKKIASHDDGRVTYVTSTKRGLKSIFRPFYAGRLVQGNTAAVTPGKVTELLRPVRVGGQPGIVHLD